MEAADTDIPPDSDSFDVYELLKMLKDMSYTGPVGLQCYGLRGNDGAEAHLGVHRGAVQLFELIATVS